MTGPIQEQIRAAATLLIEQARARGNRISVSEAEDAVRANLALKARGIPATPAAAAAAVAAVDREAIRHLTAICKVLPSLGKDPTRLRAALEGHLLPNPLAFAAMLPGRRNGLKSQLRRLDAALAGEAN